MHDPGGTLEILKPENQVDHPVRAREDAGWPHFLRDLFETVGLALVLFALINTLTARVRVDGFSMLPTLRDGELVLVNKLAYRFSSPARGDIIVFRSTTNTDMELIKRVIGLPGETVQIGGGRVLVNGQALNEPYIHASPNYSGEWHVPSGYLFVLGDNRNDSSDSHSWGFLPVENVIGKAMLIYWPPPDWAMIDHVRMALAAP